MPIEDDFLRQLMPIFKDELAEHLQAMNRILLELEKNPPIEKGDGLIEEIFREAHSLKGAAKGVGLNNIAEIAHKLESVFSAAKRHEIKFPPLIFDLLYCSLDTIENTMQQFLRGQEAPSIGGIIQALTVAARGEPLRWDRNTGVVSPVPDLEDVTEGHEWASPSEPEIADNSANSSAPSSNATKSSSLKPIRFEETVRVTTTKLDALMNSMGELLVNHLRSDQRLRELRNIYQQIESWHVEWGKISTFYTQRLSRRAGGKELPLLRFMEKTQKHMKVLRQQTNVLIENLHDDTRKMTLATNELQDNIKKMRMFPANTIFEGFERMIRDLAREENKQVKFCVEGAETELDKKIIEEIKDPFMHLLRNCVDHGIELPEERVKRGKPPCGTISLIVSQRGGGITLEVADDGAGMDVDKIKKAAVKKRFVSVKEAGLLSDKEAMSLIFKPGFSTSLILTDISGRGVGLDVVRENVERLHGMISFESEAGKGSRFIITLPLTLSTSHVSLVRCGKGVYAVPINSIDRIIMLEYAKIFSLENKMAIEVDGHPISLVDLAQVLELSVPAKRMTPDLKFPAIILGAAEKRVAFLVDAVIGESTVVVKSLGEQLVRTRNISGATILSTGKVIMILNVSDLIKTVYNQNSIGRLQLAVPEEREGNTILVVDDSITTRVLEKNILESAGYEVMLASDGDEAWSMLQDIDCNLIVSDICMPRMSGFDLTEHVKCSGRFKDIPVILVTSLASREDKERGIEVGADAYIVKSSFDQASLLETVKRLL